MRQANTVNPLNTAELESIEELPNIAACCRTAVTADGRAQADTELRQGIAVPARIGWPAGMAMTRLVGQSMPALPPD